jgi:hypothetical protein
MFGLSKKQSAGYIMGAVAIVVATTISACSSTHQDAPDPPASNIINGTNQQVIQEPDGFRNVAFSCFGSNGVYVTSRSNVDSLASSIAVVPNDPHCTAH